MAQRRTPGGQGPARRGTAAARSSAARGAVRDAGWRAPAPRAGGPAGTARPRRAGPPGARDAAATRPAAVARDAAAGRGGAQRTSAPQPRRLTGRATVLGLVLVGLLLAYAYPIRVYLSQQAEIVQLEQMQGATQARIADLKERRAKWDDPEYVKAQAKSRFQLVERGDRTYIVIFDPAGAARDAGTGTRAAAAADPPWYGKLWSSLGAANGPQR
jgi:cell division protein FtsB